MKIKPEKPPHGSVRVNLSGGVRLEIAGGGSLAHEAARVLARHLGIATGAQAPLIVLSHGAAQAPGDEAFAAQIEQEHHELHRQWAELRRTLAEVAAGSWVGSGPADFAPWQQYAALYRAHAASEEALAFPVVRAGLDDAARRAMGQEMAERRGAR